jgi:hypothetical protein
MQGHDFFYQKTTFKRSVAAKAIAASDTGRTSQEGKPFKEYGINERRALPSFLTKWRSQGWEGT